MDKNELLTVEETARCLKISKATVYKMIKKNKLDSVMDNERNLRALRKKLCKNNQPQKNDFVARAADQSLSFLFQYKLNTAICQAPDAKYPDATERSAVKSGYFAAVSVQPVRIHYLKLTEHLAPVPKRHRPFFGYLRCCQIQSL